MRYRKLGRALHAHNSRGGGGGDRGAERSPAKEDKGIFGWFQRRKERREEAPAAAPEGAQGLEAATAAAAASDSGVIDEQALQRLGEMPQPEPGPEL